MIGWCRWVLSCSRVFNQRNIASISVNNIGHCLEPAVRERHKVLAISVRARSALLVAKIIVGGTIIHSILPHVLCINLEK
jgi:hypothetical protein